MRWTWLTRRCLSGAIAFKRQPVGESESDFLAKRQRMGARIQRSKPTRCITQKFLRVRGKKAIRTDPRMIPHAVGRTNSAVEEPTRTTALRSRPPSDRGHGRPRNIVGMVDRKTGWASFRVCRNTKKDPLQEILTEEPAQEACIFTDENRSYLWLESKEEPRTREAIDHSMGWAEDRDGDGKREVHVNTIEGIRTSLRNRLRLFRGVHKDHLSGYVAMFELAFNHDRVGPEVLQSMCGV